MGLPVKSMVMRDGVLVGDIETANTKRTNG